MQTQWLAQTGGVGKDGHRKTFEDCENVGCLDYGAGFMGVCTCQNLKSVQFAIHKLYLNKVVKEKRREEGIKEEEGRKKGRKEGLVHIVIWMNFKIIVLRGRSPTYSTYCMTPLT